MNKDTDLIELTVSIRELPNGAAGVSTPHYMTRASASALLTLMEAESVPAPVFPVELDAVGKLLAASATRIAPPKQVVATSIIPAPAEEKPKAPRTRVDYSRPDVIAAGVRVVHALLAGVRQCDVQEPLINDTAVSNIYTGKLPAGPFRDAICAAYDEIDKSKNPFVIGAKREKVVVQKGGL
jgi:hypothetical protein